MSRRLGRSRWALGAGALMAVGAAALIVAAQNPAPAPASADPVATLKLVKTFDEEFDGARLDRRKWSEGEAGDALAARTLGGNGERELYMDPAYLELGIEPISVARGALTITARPFKPTDRAVVLANVDAQPPDQRAALAQLAYSSGRIATRHRFSQLYGYFEVRARFSPGRGLWPALWLLPEDGGWPPEIDIMEVLGHEPSKLYQTVHSGVMPNQEVRSSLAATDDDYHRYGVLWGPQTIDYFVDGITTGTVKTPADAHKPMYFIANLAVGGFWPGYPDADTHFPATMDIDYVRAWRFPDGAQPKR